jgi:hypothetical protein
MEKIKQTELKELMTYTNAGFTYARVCQRNGYTVFKACDESLERPIYEVFKGKYKVPTSKWGIDAWTMRSWEDVMNKIYGDGKTN